MATEFSDRLYFYHIPKTSGTTSLAYLRAMFGSHNVYDGGIWDNLILRSPEELRSFRVFWGHFMGMLDSFVGIDTLKLTLIRDPLDRTVSHYLHVQRSPDHPLFRIVVDQSLHDFVTDPRTRWMVENYQAKYLYLSHLDVRSLHRGLDVPTGLRGVFQQELESLPLPGLSEARLFETSSRRLKSFFMVDTAERCTQTMRELADITGRTVETAIPRERERPGHQAPPTLHADTIRAIRAATRVDRALYEMTRDAPIRNPPRAFSV